MTFGNLSSGNTFDNAAGTLYYRPSAPGTFRRDVAYAVHARDGALAALREQRAATAWAPCDGQPGDVARVVETDANV